MNSPSRAVYWVVAESFFLLGYVFTLKFVFADQGSLLSAALLCVIVSLSFVVFGPVYGFVYEYPQFKRERKDYPLLPGKHWRWFPLWSLFFLMGDSAYCLAVTFDAPLGESGLLFRGVTVSVIGVGSWKFFSQVPSRRQVIGIIIGLLATLTIALVVGLTKNGLIQVRYEYLFGVPIWGYFMLLMTLSNSSKDLVSRHVIPLMPKAVTMFWSSVSSLCLSLLYFAVAWSIPAARVNGLPDYFWCGVSFCCLSLFFAIPFRYAAKNAELNPVIHDGVRYCVVLIGSFGVDFLLHANAVREGKTIVWVLPAVAVTILLSAASTLLLINGEKKPLEL